MKNILLLTIMLFTGITLGAQANLLVEGYVFDTSNQPVEAIHITINAVQPINFNYSNTLTTDVNGFYSDTLEGVPFIGALDIHLEDCSGGVITETQLFIIDSLSLPYISQNFTYCQDSADICHVEIYGDSLNFNCDSITILTAVVSGPEPYTYLWSNGATTVYNSVSEAGCYGVTVTNGFGCTSRDNKCVEFSDDCCHAYIDQIGLNLVAYGSGNAPFIYVWSGGSTSSTITPSLNGLYSVTVTDNDGCEAESHYWFSGNNVDSCAVVVTEDPLTGCFTAQPNGEAPFTYDWSAPNQTGDTFCPDFEGFYSVNVTDANGCIAVTFFLYERCRSYIAASSSAAGAELSVENTGIAPFTYLWETGAITSTITVSETGNYCVTVTDATSCESTGCYWYHDPSVDSCSVVISDITMNPEATLIAQATGNGPFIYYWNTGETGNFIFPTVTGNYCVTAINADSCVSTSCYYFQSNPGTDSCGVQIVNFVNATQATLFANAVGTMPIQYIWNTGETGTTIHPTESGVYCVQTIAADSCVSEHCIPITFNPPVDSVFTFCGSVLLPNGLDTAFHATAFLIQSDTLQGTLTLVDTVEVWGSEFCFDQIPFGAYLVKVALQPDSEGYENYLPTYFGDVLFWNETIPITEDIDFFHANIHMIAGVNPGGPGFVGGLVIEGANFAGIGDTRDADGDPVANVEVLLLTESGTPVAYTYSNAEGEFSFADLAYGTYQLVIEIPGFEQAIYSFTISAENPTVTDISFVVDEDSVAPLSSTNTEEDEKLAAQLTISPNPTHGAFIVEWIGNDADQLMIRMFSLDGRQIYNKNENVASGVNHIKMEVDGLPNGVYLLSIQTTSQLITRKLIKQAR